MGDVFRVDMDVPKSGQQKSPVQIDHLSITGVRGPATIGDLNNAAFFYRDAGLRNRIRVQAVDQRGIGQDQAHKYL